jgi:hypothetical protein
MGTERDTDVKDGEREATTLSEEGVDRGEEGGRVGEREVGEGEVLKVADDEGGLGEWVIGGLRGWDRGG